MQGHGDTCGDTWGTRGLALSCPPVPVRVPVSPVSLCSHVPVCHCVPVSLCAHVSRCGRVSSRVPSCPACLLSPCPRPQLSEGVERYISKFEINQVLSDRSNLIIYLDKVGTWGDVGMGMGMRWDRTEMGTGTRMG